MRYILPLLITLFLLLPGAQAQPNSELFQGLLKEGDLEFREPGRDFVRLPVEPDFVMPYEARYRSRDGELEIRYAIRPLGRIEIDYEDPHNAAPAPNDLFNMLFRALSETLARNHDVLSREYEADKARQEYRAGWAAVGVFDLAEGISEDYDQGMLIAIHQNDKADAYLLFLTRDLGTQKPRIRKLRDSLRFRHFENPINEPDLQEGVAQ